MSVRIYQLSKQLQMENKDLILILKERGLKADSPSNTIPNIYADALLEEYKDRLAPVSSVEPAALKVEEPIAKPEATVVSPSIPVAPPAAEPEAVMVDAALPVATVSVPAPLPAVAKLPAAPALLPGKMAPGVPSLKGLTAPALPPRPPAFPKPASLPRPVSTAALQPKAPTPVVVAAPAAHIVVEPEVTVSGLPPAAPAYAKAPALPPMQKAPAALPPRPVTRPPVPVAVEVSLENAEGVTAEAIPAPAALRKALCKPPVVVRDFATLLDVKPFRLISELMEMGIFASMNQVIDEDVAVRLALRHGVELEVRHRGETQAQQPAKKVVAAIREAILESRPAVVCVLGHVDHGKTTLLDTIRRTNVVKGEAGGITQHIGAYQVEHRDHKITFIDTPGHAAFSKMRERGANVTDIAVLVVAADDGFMPQTDEALKFAQKANVPVVVAVNKMDAKGANLEKVKQQLQQRGIASEDWGGETLVAPISAIKGDGMPELLDSILLQAEMLDLKADPKGPAEVTIIEAQMEQGLGCTASVIVKEGTLRIGDTLVCGTAFCRVRSMADDKGKPLKEARPSTPLKTIGWSETPEAGLIARVVKNEKEAKVCIEDFIEARKRQAQREAAPKIAMSMESLFASLGDQKKLLKVLIKADVHGSVEALAGALLAIKSTKVSLEVIDSSVGLISKSDVMLASTSGTTIVAFNTKLDTGVPAVAKHEGVRIIQHNIIYELIDQVREAMAELLDPDLKEVKVGAAEVRQLFSLTKGAVAGCMVTEGKITRDSQARLIRKGTVLHEGKVVTLKRFKDDANEVRAGYECGIRLEGYDNYQAKDIIESYIIEKIPATL